MTGGADASLTGDVDDVHAEVAELLGLDVGAVDPTASLISQGLDSIRMMSLAGRWRRRGRDVDFATLSADPTVAAWSKLVAAEAPVEAVAEAAAPDTAADGPFPLAPMQHAMWVGRDDSQPLGGVAGHLYVEFDSGPIDPERLAQAATLLARRHPMLRVQFRSDGTQFIDPASADADFPVVVRDLRDIDEPAELLADVRRDKSHQQLDGQVFELTLTLLPGDVARLHVDLDMQAADAMSYRTLMADLAMLYRGEQLTELGFTYPEYRREMARRETQSRPAHDADREWWARRIPDLPDPPQLPASHHTTTSRRSSRRWHWFDPRTRDALFRHARARDVTPAMAFAAAFSHTVACWSGASRFLLNVPLFGREPLHPDVDRVVGDFTSSLLLDVDFTDTGDAASRSQAVQEAMRTAAAHAAYPGLSVLRDLARHRGTTVLAPVVFTSALGLGELFAPKVTDTFGGPSWIISQGPQVTLDAQVTEFDGGVLVNWDVRDDVFPAGVIDAMFAHHIDELHRLAHKPGAWVEPDPPALPAGQRAVRDTVNTRTTPAGSEALHDGFFRQADQQPDAVALIGNSGQLSYGRLRDQVLSLAATLRDNGVGAGDTVALLGPKTAEQVPAVLAILAIGGVYLPISLDQPPDRAGRILRAGDVRLALVCGGNPMPASVPTLVIADVLQQAADRPRFTPDVVDPASLAYVLFTSGSTGEPKGVEVTHHASMNTVEFIGRHFDIGPQDRCLALSTLEGDISVMDIFVTLRTGGTIVVVEEAQRRDPDAWARLIDAYGVTVLHFMPGWLEMLTEVGAGRLSSVRVVPTGGDWVRPEVVRRLRAESPGMRFAGLGGATETATHNTIYEVGDLTALPDGVTALPFGVPLPNNSCRVVDDRGHDRPDWVPGELWISGRGVARGYRGRPDLTAEKFVVQDGRTWYRTGDLARYWPDGVLEFVGRADHRVKISGYRVEIGEVEAALRRVPGVAKAIAAVVSVTGGADVLAAAVCADHDAPTAEAVRGRLAELVPAHMVPQHICFVDTLDYTPGGKIDRRAVTARLSQAMSQMTGPMHRAPSGAVEFAIATIVGDVLGIDSVGADDDFFALGGDSVLATQTVARIRTWLDSPDVVVADIFATRTPSRLSAALVGRQADPGRLEQVAELYREIVGMDAGCVAAAVSGIEATQ